MLASLCVLGILRSQSGVSAAPRIDRIEPFLTDLILIHFDTEANRDYQLQYAESATAPEASWITLYPAPNLPFPNHYIVPDSRTHAHRFYRLKVTP